MLLLDDLSEAGELALDAVPWVGGSWKLYRLGADVRGG